jgi:hypothetical protein
MAGRTIECRKGGQSPAKKEEVRKRRKDRCIKDTRRRDRREKRYEGDMERS